MIIRIGFPVLMMLFGFYCFNQLMDFVGYLFNLAFLDDWGQYLFRRISQYFLILTPIAALVAAPMAAILLRQRFQAIINRDEIRLTSINFRDTRHFLQGSLICCSLLFVPIGLIWTFQVFLEFAVHNKPGWWSVISLKGVAIVLMVLALFINWHVGILHRMTVILLKSKSHRHSYTVSLWRSTLTALLFILRMPIITIFIAYAYYEYPFWDAIGGGFYPTIVCETLIAYSRLTRIKAAWSDLTRRSPLYRIACDDDANIDIDTPWLDQ